MLSTVQVAYQDLRTKIASKVESIKDKRTARIFAFLDEFEIGLASFAATKPSFPLFSPQSLEEQLPKSTSGQARARARTKKMADAIHPLVRKFLDSRLKAVETVTVETIATGIDRIITADKMQALFQQYFRLDYLTKLIAFEYLLFKNYFETNEINMDSALTLKLADYGYRSEECTSQDCACGEWGRSRYHSALYFKNDFGRILFEYDLHRTSLYSAYSSALVDDVATYNTAIKLLNALISAPFVVSFFPRDKYKLVDYSRFEPFEEITSSLALLTRLGPSTAALTDSEEQEAVAVARKSLADALDAYIETAHHVTHATIMARVKTEADDPLALLFSTLKAKQELLARAEAALQQAQAKIIEARAEYERKLSSMPILIRFLHEHKLTPSTPEELETQLFAFSEPEKVLAIIRQMDIDFDASLKTSFGIDVDKDAAAPLVPTASAGTRSATALASIIMGGAGDVPIDERAIELRELVRKS